MSNYVTKSISRLQGELLGLRPFKKGSRLLVVGSNNSKDRAPFNQTMLALQKKGMFKCVPFLAPSGSEAKIDTVDDGVLMAQKTGCEGIVSVGGGSMMDVGKMISAVLARGGSIYDYVKVKNSSNKSVKGLFDREGGNDGTIVNVSVPTLLGSGAELSNHAALLYPAEEKVLMFSNDLLRSDLVVIDKSFIKGVPSDLEAAASFSNFARAFDLYTSHNETLLHVDDSRNVNENDGLDWFAQSVASLESSNLSLSAILQNSKDFIDIKHEDRVDIFTNASFQSAHTLNMSNSGFSISARFAQTICGLFSVPYAYVHSATFIPLLKTRLEAAKKSHNHQDLAFLDRVQSVASLVCGQNCSVDATDNIDDLINYLDHVQAKLGLKSMKELGFSRTDSELATSLIFTEKELESIQILGRDKILDVIVEEC